MCVSIKGSRCVLKKCGEFLSSQVLHQTYLTKESPTPSQDGVVPAWNISLLGTLKTVVWFAVVRSIALSCLEDMPWKAKEWTSYMESAIS